MKRNLNRYIALLMIVVLSITACGYARGDQKTIMEGNEDEIGYIHGLSVIEDTAYILYGGNEFGKSWQIYTWKEGQKDPLIWAEGLISFDTASRLQREPRKEKPSEDVINHAVTRLFTDGKKLMSFNPLNGKVFSISSQDGKAVFEDVITLKDTTAFMDIIDNYSDLHTCTGCMVSGELLIWTASFYDNEMNQSAQRLILADLSSGNVTVSNSVEHVAYSGQGHDGIMVLFLRDDENAYDRQKNRWVPYTVSAYDPKADILKELGRIEVQYLNAAPVWSETLEQFVYIDDNSHIYAMSLDGTTKQVGFYQGNTRLDESGIAVVGSTVLIPGQSSLYACSAIADFNPDRKLTLYQYKETDAQRLFNGEHPEVPIYVYDKYFDDSQMLLMAMTSGDLDVLSFSSSNGSYEALRDKGYLLDLSGNMEISALMENVWEPLREYCTKDGHVFAVPYDCSIDISLWGASNAALKETGLTVEDLPTDFIGLCGFLTMWNDEMADNYPNISPIVYEGEAITRSDLISMAVRYYVRYMNTREEELTFDTPLFREMAQAAENTRTDIIESVAASLGEEEFYSREPLLEYGMTFRDQWINDYYSYFEMKPAPECESIACVNLRVLAINASSNDKKLSSDFVLDAMKATRKENRHMLYSDAAEPLEDSSVISEIKKVEDNIALIQDAMKTADDSAYVEQLAGQEAILTYYQQHLWAVSPDEITAFREKIVPIMIVQKPDVFYESDGNSSGEMRSLVRRWRDGQIDAEQFIREAEVKLNMIRLEGR